MTAEEARDAVFWVEGERCYPAPKPAGYQERDWRQGEKRSEEAAGGTGFAPS